MDRVVVSKISLLITIGIMALLLAPTVTATTYTCINSSYLLRTINITKTESSTVTPYTWSETLYCPHGCEDGLGKYGADCIDPPYLTTLYVLMGIVILFGFMTLVVKGRRG